jgi:hypothetical protein
MKQSTILLIFQIPPTADSNTLGKLDAINLVKITEATKPLKTVAAARLTLAILFLSHLQLYYRTAKRRYLPRSQLFLLKLVPLLYLIKIPIKLRRFLYIDENILINLQQQIHMFQ